MVKCVINPYFVKTSLQLRHLSHKPNSLQLKMLIHLIRKLLLPFFNDLYVPMPEIFRFRNQYLSLLRWFYSLRIEITGALIFPVMHGPGQLDSLYSSKVFYFKQAMQFNKKNNFYKAAINKK